MFIAPVADEDTVGFSQLGALFAVIHQFDRPQGTHTLDIADHVKFHEFGQLFTDLLAEFSSAFHEVFAFHDFDVGQSSGAADAVTAVGAAAAELFAGFAESGSDLLGGDAGTQRSIAAGLEYISKEREKSGLDYYTQHDAIKNFNFVRKGHCMFGWDWGPQLPDGGINRDVYLEILDVNQIRDVEVCQETCIEESKIHLNIENEIVCDSYTTIKMFDRDDCLIYESADITKEFNSFDFVIKNPKLWNPVGYGEAYLYTLVVENISPTNCTSSKTMKVGLRKIEVVQDEDEFGKSFYVRCNGNPIFMKGSNYILEDNIIPRTNEQRTRQLLLDAVNCNHNSIRVWGGALYPVDYFFDICDELGILVWQDLMFACAYYDAQNKEFLENIRYEIIDNMKRIRNHACLALVCGNNELEIALSWNPPNRDIAIENYLHMFENFIPNVIKEVLPNTFYWLSSPSSTGSFHQPNNENIGDMHYWGVWHGNEPIEAYRNHYPRFMSEYGLQSFPSLKTIKSFATEEDFNVFSYIMECHQKNGQANLKIFSYIAKMFKFPNSFESFIFLSQVIQAEGIKYCTEHLRRNYGRCMGSLYWQLNDCWPVASWSSIDYFGRFKALQYFSKKFYAPILLSLEEDKENSKLKVNVNNETLSSINGNVEIKAMKLDGEILWTDVIPVCVSSLSAKYIKEYSFNLEKKEKHDYYVDARLKIDGNEVSNNYACFALDKHLLLRKPNINIELFNNESRYELHISSDVVTKYVEIEIIDLDINISDNFFNLIPYEKKIITFDSLDEVTLDMIKVKSLYDTF